MIKVFDCLVDIKKQKPEYEEMIQNIMFLTKAETIYELHDYLDDDVYMFNEMVSKGIINPNQERSKLFLEVRKFLIEQIETVEYVLDQDVYTVDLDNEDIFKQSAKDANDNSGFPVYLLKALYADDLEWALKEFEKDTLEDPFNSMTFKGACKKALEFDD